MGIGDSIGAAVAAKHKEKAAKRELSAARRDRELAVRMAAGANYEPDLISEHIGPYQRSQSPVARGYLESFLTGANPQAVQGVRAGAPKAQAAAQAAQTQAYGGWDELRAKQRAMEQSTPWDIKPFDKPIVNEDMKANALQQYSDPVAEKRWGLSQDQVRGLQDYGITFDGRGGWHGDKGGDATKTAEALRGMVEHGDTGAVERFLAQGVGGKAGARAAQDEYTKSRMNPAVAAWRAKMGAR